MTATPTPLRELPAKWRRLSRYEEEDGELSVGDESAIRLRLCADELEAALSARDEAGAVGSAYDGLCPCCGEIECEEPATPPASGEAGAVYRCDYCGSDYTQAKYCCQARRDYLNAHGQYETATPPAASGDDVGYSSADALNPNLRVLRQIAVKMPPSWEREALFHAELDLGMQIRRLAAVAPAGMDGGAVLRIPRSERLDPITAYFEDYEPGRGRMVVACYGSAWVCSWGAMGDRSVREFVAGRDAHYLAGNALSLGPHVGPGRRNHTERVMQAVIDALAAPTPPATAGQEES